jgi:hypothetical protein
MFFIFLLLRWQPFIGPCWNNPFFQKGKKIFTSTRKPSISSCLNFSGFIQPTIDRRAPRIENWLTIEAIA